MGTESPMASERLEGILVVFVTKFAEYFTEALKEQHKVTQDKKNVEIEIRHKTIFGF